MSIVNERLLLKTALNPNTGYGGDGIYLAEALEEAGAEVHIEPRQVGVPLTHTTAAILTRSRPKHFETAICHDYPGELGFPQRMPQFANKIVGWTMYEFTGFGDNTDMTDRLEERLSSLDLLLVYDDVSLQAMTPYFDPERIKILQGGYNAEFWIPTEEETVRSWDGTFKFIMNGTMNRRKDPFVAINAFNELKREYGDEFDAELHMHTTEKVLHPRMEQVYPGLKIFYELWTPEQLKNFYLNSHCLLSPSWGEGKNLPALEAMTTGCPVIVSKVGGHLQWANESYAYLIDGTWEEHSPEQGSLRVDKDAFRDAMWHVYTNRAETRQKGELASQTIPAMCDWKFVVERLKFILDALEPKSRVSS